MKVSTDRKMGFTLIEIMVVISIVSILVALAVPQMLRSRMNANELAAITSLRTISNACQSYYNDISPHSYPPNLPALSATIPNYINSTLANAVDEDNTKQGYYFSYSIINAEQFTIIAWPKVFGRTGGRNFFINEIGNITYTRENGLAPDPTSPPVE